MVFGFRGAVAEIGSDISRKVDLLVRHVAEQELRVRVPDMGSIY
jgi:hypothetical protein